MRVFFSGIGGAGIGPLALIAQQTGYDVVGSDKQQSQYTDYLEQHGLALYIGQTAQELSAVHASTPIDWYVYSSALPLENPNHPELLEAKRLGIKISKRDEFLAHFLDTHKLKLLAMAGTHGKTTSTAMAVWAMKKLGLDPSYSVGAKLSYGDMGHYSPKSPYFVYECDEFDRNFLAFKPFAATLTKVDWDHHEQYPTRQDYIEAFRQFCTQSKNVIAHAAEATYLNIAFSPTTHVVPDSLVGRITLAGAHNRMNAAGVAYMLHTCLNVPLEDVIDALNSFPGSNRRFEQIAPAIYSDYAHTPEEIAATLQLAHEVSNNIVVVYEPLTNRRQHFMKDAYASLFTNINKLYWLPSYLAREDPGLRIIQPQEFVDSLNMGNNAVAAEKNSKLKELLSKAVDNGCIVVLLAGGGGGSLDEWARQEFTLKT